jgi:hypothetical protein
MAREIGHFAHGELGIERRELDYRRASRPLWVGYPSVINLFRAVFSCSQSKKYQAGFRIPKNFWTPYATHY